LLSISIFFIENINGFKQTMALESFLKIAVLSDLHVHELGSNGPGYVGVHSETSPLKDPFLGLGNLITEEKLSADLVFCPGDICDKSNPNALRYAWERLNNLKTTAGNHDMDSRLVNSEYDAKGALQSLTPFFPIDDENLCDKYWSRNFVVIIHGNVRIVVLNSAAYHGYAEEYKHGRISDSTLERLKGELEQSDNHIRQNILLCHHHPHKHGDIEADDYSSMKSGEKLIDMFGSGHLGNWLIIHGHKHHPRICYGAHSGGNPPIVFSAGSFAARLTHDLQHVARNQFYIIELFNLDDIPSNEMFMPGQFTAWDWIQNSGWQSPGNNSGLPRNAGFGCKTNIDHIAKSIRLELDKDGVHYLNYEELLELHPSLQFLLPIEHQNLLIQLKANKLQCMFDDEQLLQVGIKL
jgi:predicted phosphodiesterase